MAFDWVIFPGGSSSIDRVSKKNIGEKATVILLYTYTNRYTAMEVHQNRGKCRYTTQNRG